MASGSSSLTCFCASGPLNHHCPARKVVLGRVATCVLRMMGCGRKGEILSVSPLNLEQSLAPHQCLQRATETCRDCPHLPFWSYLPYPPRGPLTLAYRILPLPRHCLLSSFLHSCYHCLKHPLPLCLRPPPAISSCSPPAGACSLGQTCSLLHFI